MPYLIIIIFIYPIFIMYFYLKGFIFVLPSVFPGKNSRTLSSILEDTINNLAALKLNGSTLPPSPGNPGENPAKSELGKSAILDAANCDTLERPELVKFPYDKIGKQT